MKKRYLFAALCLWCGLSVSLHAQDKRNMFNPVTTSVTSQSIAPDARGGSMGDIGAATEPDVSSQYWNPAKYPFASHGPEWGSTTHRGCDSW